MIHPLTHIPTWHTASAQGPRSVNADAVGAYGDPGQTVFALADGVGDDHTAARAARIACAAAVRTPPGEGPIAALLAAQRAVRADPAAGDCVLVVALPFAGGYRIGWVGDVRAYAWTGSTLRPLTKDHTLAEYFRDRGEEVVPRMEHIVTTSVRTAEATAFGRAEVRGLAGLLLTSDGVHKNLSLAAMAELVRRAGNSAQSLVDSALAVGGTDNATALLAELPPSPGPEPATEAFTSPVAA